MKLPEISSIIKIFLPILLMMIPVNRTEAQVTSEGPGKPYIFGGSEHDYGSGIAVIDDDFFIIAGSSASESFPGISNVKTNGPLGKSEILITLISRKDMSIVNMLVVGGSDNDFVKDIHLDQHGFLYVIGNTYSHDFPADKRFGELNQEDKNNAFVLKINQHLDGNVEAILFGGRGYDYPGTITLSSDGVYVAGYTTSSNYPVTDGAHQTIFNDIKLDNPSYGHDTFITKFDHSLSTILTSTFLGGDGDEYISDIEILPDSEVIVTGYTHSPNFPRTEGSYRSKEPSGGIKTFITTFPSNLEQISKSTIVEATNQLYVKSMAIAPDQSIWVTGYCTRGTFPFLPNTFPTTDGTIAPTYNGGGHDGFIIHFTKDLKNIISSSYLGGNDNDFVQSINLTQQGHIIIAGFTDSFGSFPKAISRNNQINFGHFDTFVTELSYDLSTIYSTYMNGGSDYDYSFRTALHRGSMYILGNTTSQNMDAIYLNETGNRKKKNDFLFEILELTKK